MLICILLAAALVTGLMQHWVDTYVILAVVVINCIIGFVQEYKAEKALAEINKLLSLKATVFRSFEPIVIDAALLVPGDMVQLTAGDKVPADIRLVDANSLRVQESILTGEAFDVEKSASEVAKKIHLANVPAWHIAAPKVHIF